MIAAVEKLADFPKMGRAVPEAEGREDVRELIYQDYRILYLIQPERLFVVAVIHGSQDLSRKENKPWDDGWWQIP
ncbi:type II toxin-antitoxin system RelE/ParE family toxin [Candidatus Thiosymbion oneisti]|uniref:type II toxin-antitoxin system RelE/ParE family toxin n=1 Tax=Candidatus Thiosymbion oneisti TaxID=589554 RepID=UPI000B7CC6F0|nr:type II toxin-antitoxin system RelE/ParE family toxin [Candidatus Thiosymbion oneisti]